MNRTEKTYEIFFCLPGADEWTSLEFAKRAHAKACIDALRLSSNAPSVRTRIEVTEYQRASKKTIRLALEAGGDAHLECPFVDGLEVKIHKQGVGWSFWSTVTGPRFLTDCVGSLYKLIDELELPDQACLVWVGE